VIFKSPVVVPPKEPTPPPEPEPEPEPEEWKVTECWFLGYLLITA